MSMKRQSVSDGKVVWANPSDITNTFTAKVQSTPKTILGGGSLPNIGCDFSNLKRLPVVKGGVPSGDEQCSIRVRTSCSAQNATAMIAEWQLTKARIDAALVELAAQGFVPGEAVIVTELSAG